MGNCYKNGRVVLILNGKFSGHKALIINNSEKKFSNDPKNLVLLGIKTYPKKITRKMLKNKIDKRSKIRTFVKIMNKNHVFPTRYVMDFETYHKEIIEKKVEEIFDSKKNSTKEKSSGTLNKFHFFPLDNIFMQKYFSGKNKWFFTPLKF
mmetsp:Transcript_19161/g.39090  ORF Transcript_19161/g.39090 Transcript_19161/m.39090 type:complete len:150 (-) Transcript_19161:877-1326(-)